VRILITADVDPAEVIGGAERMLVCEAEGLASRGHQVTILTRHDGGIFPLRETIRGFEVVRFPVPAGRGVRSLFSTLRIAKQAAADLLAQQRPDIIYAQQPMVSAGALMASAARHIRLVHNYLSPWGEEHRIRALGRRLPLADPNTARSTPGELAQVALRRKLESRVARRAQRLRLMSEYMAGQCRRLHGIPADRITIVPGGVDTGHFCPPANRESLRAGLGVCPDQPLLFTVRNLVPRMGLGNLLDALAIVLPGSPRTVCILGGTGPLEAALRHRVAEIGLGQGVRFAGFIPEGRLPDYYGAADLFVLPTAALEGFGLVTAEALACGTPAVGTPVGGTPELLHGLDPRLICEGTKPTDIANGILANLGRARADGEWRRHCRDYAVSRYSWPRVIDQVERLLEEARA
jgi:glycosyltransferase involved in cell wall biosynthesis